MSERHVITEAELDENPWATCGPAALAGLLARPLGGVRSAFMQNTTRSTWTNLPRMLQALHQLGQRWRMTPAGGGDGAGGGAPEHGIEHVWPTRGLVLVQFRGGWDEMAINHAAQLTRSHWIAVIPGDPLITRPPFVFDVNAVGAAALKDIGYWQPRQLWEHVMVPLIAEHFGRKATGKWWVRAGIEVLP